MQISRPIASLPPQRADFLRRRVWFSNGYWLDGCRFDKYSQNVVEGRTGRDFTIEEMREFPA